MLKSADLNQMLELRFFKQPDIDPYTLIQQIRRTIKNANRVILNSNDRFFFTCSFFAALSERKTILLPHMHNDDVLSSIKQEDDFVLNEGTVLSNSTNSTPITFDGESLVIFYTSGTTGKPKEITKTYKQLEIEVQSLVKTFDIQHHARFISTVPHYHIYGLLFSILLPVYTQGEIVRQTCVLWDDVFSYQIQNSFLVSSPSHLTRLDDSLKWNNPFIRIFTASAPMPYAAAQECLASFSILPTEIYGSTETGGIAFRQQKKEQTPWQVFDGISIEKGDDECLVLESPYLKNREHTNDRIHLHNNQQFDLLGRNDRIVKVEGKRICLQDIETKLMEHPFITDVYCLMISNKNRDLLSVAITLTEEGKEALQQQEKKDFIKILKNHLALYFDLIFLPRRWKILSDMPLSLLGKKDKLQLEQILLQDD